MVDTLNKLLFMHVDVNNYVCLYKQIISMTI